MKLIVLIIILATPLCSLASNRPGKKQDARIHEQAMRLEALKREYADLQTELQSATERRWNARQKQVAAKAENKEKTEQVQQQIERMYSDVARAREEFLSRQNILEKEKEVLDQKELERTFLIQIINGKKEQESIANLAGFPIGQDTRIADLARIDRRFPDSRAAAQKFQALVSYHLATLARSGEVGLGRRTFVSGDGEAITAQTLRIGHSMAYAMTPDGDVYFLGSSGRLEGSRFEWHRIANADMAAALAASFPGWIRDRAVTGVVPVDIMQNRYSASLIGGERQTWRAASREFFRAGGPVLAPLALIVLWGLLLVLNRAAVYAIRYGRSRGFIRQAVALLSSGEKQKAQALAEKKKGVHARILGACLKHPQWKRDAAEKTIKEILLSEVPALERHLNTLAVLAAAAPLLGLLGTVTGMIRMFEAITRFGTGDPRLLAGGISEALITTQVGLSIAIPLLLIHNFLRNRRNRIQAHLEMYAMQILNRLWPED